MAVTIKTAQFGRDTCPQAQFTVSITSDSGGSATYSWELKWVTHGYTVSSSASKAYTAKIDGVTVASGSFAIGGKTTQVIKSGTYTVNKGTSSRTVPISLSFDMTFTWSGVSGGTKTASGSFNIAAKTSYTISYNANGGSGAPSAQTKWYGTNLTLSSGKPSRTGHNFVRWNTNTSNTGTAYSPGGTYTANAAATLYAIWTPHTYTVQYNANGGTGAPGNQTKTYGTNLTLTTAKPTRPNYNFLGWSTSASGGVVYSAGGTYTANSGVTLYAVWELAYLKPRITNFNAFRCDANGNPSETGIYIKATFNWATDKTVSGVYVQYKGQQAGSWSGTGNYANSSTSGSVSSIVGGADYVDTETSYHVRAFVQDSGGITYSTTISIGTTKFPIDVKAGGTGVAIGKVAEHENLFDVGLPAKFNNGVTFVTKSTNKQISSPGWYRVAKCSVTGASFIANLYTYYNYTNNSSYVLSFNLTYQNGLIHMISGWENTANTLEYVRLVKDSADGCIYVEVYYNVSVLNDIYFEIINNGNNGICVTNFESPTSTSTELYFIRLVPGINVSAGQANRGSWNVPTRGLITQVTDNSNSQHSVMVGLKSDGKTRLYGMDLYDSDTNPIMRFYAGNKYLSIDQYGVNADGYYLQSRPDVIYDNSSGSNGTITLTKSVTNYSYIEIFFKDNNTEDYGSVKVHSPNGKSVALSCIEANSVPKTMIRTNRYGISGTTMTVEKSAYASIFNNAYSTVTTGNYVYVTKVIGIY